MLYPFLAVPVLSRVTWVTFDSTLDLEINKIRNMFALKQIKRSRSELGWLGSITHHFHVRFSRPPASASAASAYLRRAGHAEVAAAPTGGEPDMGWISQASLYVGIAGKAWQKKHVFLLEIRFEHGTSWICATKLSQNLSTCPILNSSKSTPLALRGGIICEVPLRWSGRQCTTSSCLCSMTIFFYR